jgi:signal transduction histidine kinase
VDGRLLEEILASVPEPVREAVKAGNESLFTVPSGDRDETFRFVRREFYLNTQRHSLLMFELLTPELRRQELAIWKRAIRTMNHELNNSIAPLSSLMHSARVAASSPRHAHRVDEIDAAIEERLSHLREFLAAYATFARLPAPRKAIVPWCSVIEDVRRLYSVEVECVPTARGFFDRAQIEQLLINLVKNAHESGSPAEEVRISIRQTDEGTLLRVEDRGCGLSEPAMRQALLPFYSTKPDGTGLGLALASEIIEAHGGRITLQRRDGGGTAVAVVLPSAPRDV